MECFHNEEEFQDVPSADEVWNGGNLGEVFGLTLDDQSPPNIYVSASSVYVVSSGMEPSWPAGESAGSVYRLDGTTGAITSCVQLPSISNAALGNLCFDRDDAGDGWLYVSNLEDGFIYRVSEDTCEIENTFAHPFAPADDGLPGLSQFGRRIWRVEIHDGRLFYALWNDYDTTPQQIWSVALEPDGDFDLSDVIMEFDVPVYFTDATPWENSYIIDCDGISGQDPKGDFGEVDILRTECACITAAINEIICPVQPGSDYEVLLDITNILGETGFTWTATPCTAAELPSGALTIATPDGDSFEPLLGDGETQTVSIGIPSSFAGETVCFNLTMLDDLGNECCTIKVCVEMPFCTCFTIVEKSIECVRDTLGNVKWTLDITLTNHAGWEAQSVTITPLGGSPFTPILGQVIDPIPDGGTGSFTLCLESSGDPGLEEGDTLCFNLFLNSSDPHVNCEEICCVRLPYCEVLVVDDDCILSRRVPCCPGTNTATVSYTICNNSDEERTYSWDIESMAGCPVFLPTSAYVPAGGVVIIPAHTCETFFITVDCSSLQPGACAAFKACFSQVNPTGPKICCKGSVYVPLPGQLVAKVAYPVDDPVTLPWGEIGTLKLDLFNPGTTPISTQLFLKSNLGAVNFGQGNTSSGFVLPVDLAVGEEKCIALPIQLNPRYATIQRRSFQIQIYGNEQELNSTVVYARSNDLAISGLEVTQNANQAKIVVMTERGKRYQLQQSSGLATGDWANVLSEFDGGDAPVELIVAIQGDQKRFFRVLEVPQQ